MKKDIPRINGFKLSKIPELYRRVNFSTLKSII